jgi:hypothetical protein
MLIECNEILCALYKPGKQNFAISALKFLAIP